VAYSSFPCSPLLQSVKHHVASVDAGAARIRHYGRMSHSVAVTVASLPDHESGIVSTDYVSVGILQQPRNFPIPTSDEPVNVSHLIKY